jgi:hypothetical protein
MKQLRVALGASVFYIAALAGSLPAQASILDIRIDNPSISVMPPSSRILERFFTGSIKNTSAYDLNFDQQTDANFSVIGGIGVRLLYTGPGEAQGPLTYIADPITGVSSEGGLLQQPLFGSCNWGGGISSSCLRAGETFTGVIAAAIVGSDTAPGLYAVTQDGVGHPATITFMGTYFQNGQLISFTQDSAALSVNVMSEHAVPEPRTWTLLVAGLVGMMLLSSKRVRSKGLSTT